MYNMNVFHSLIKGDNDCKNVKVRDHGINGDMYDGYFKSVIKTFLLGFGIDFIFYRRPLF